MRFKRFRRFKISILILFIISSFFLAGLCEEGKTELTELTIFEKSIKFVLKWEGGYTNEVDEPDGKTKYGISKRWYPHLDIKNLTIDKAKKIYYEDYWLKSGCDKLAFPFNIIVFDTSISMGRSRAKQFLNTSSSWRDFLLRRIAFYSECKNSKEYIRGWVNRVIDLYNLIEEEIEEK